MTRCFMPRPALVQRTLIAFIFAAALSAAPCPAADEAEIYVNAGTEKYLQGRFDDAVENLEKARALDPGNRKIAGLMVQVLLEAATQRHLQQNYRAALVYLAKARALAPDHPKVKEMHRLTESLLNRSPESAPVPENAASALLRRGKAAPEDGVRARGTPDIPAKKKVVAPSPPPAVDPFRRNGTVPEGRLARFLAAYASAATAFALLFAVLSVRSRRRARALKITLDEAGEEAARQREEKNKLIIELERMKERVKYEHQSAEQFRHELKDQRRKEEEQQRAERARVASLADRGDPSAGSSLLSSRQQAQFMEYLNEAGPAEESTSPALEASRERIAAMVESLYLYSQEQAMEFINRTAQHANPLMRANIIAALARIGSPETMDIVFRLYEDADPRVKREALRHVKQLHQKIAAGILFLDEGVQDKLRAVMEKERSRGEWIV